MDASRRCDKGPVRYAGSGVVGKLFVGFFYPVRPKPDLIWPIDG